MRCPVTGHRPAASHAATGDVDQDGQSAHRACGLDGPGHRGIVVDVAADGHDPFAELIGQRRGPFEVLIEDRDPDLSLVEEADGSGAEATRSAGDDC